MGGEYAEASEPTELAGVADADTMSVYAWSQAGELDEDGPRREWPFWVTTAAVGLSLAFATIAGVLAYRHLGGQEEPSRPIALPALATTTAVEPTPKAAPPPPPVTVTTVVVQAPPPTTAPEEVQYAPPPGPVWNQGLDNTLVGRLQSQGFTVWDPVALTGQAHNICMMLARGTASPQGVINELSAPGSPTTPLEARIFVTTIMQTYPNCP